MSKSGLYAHFKSKEELELATIETAAEIFENAVMGKIPESTRGLARVGALSEAFLEHLEQRVFPGGCFFAAVSVQLATQPGRARDRVMQLNGAWGGQFATALGQACDDGELPPDVDLEQLAFEITAMLFRANFAWVLSGDRRVLKQAEVGLKNVLARVTPQSRPAARGRGKK
jgi:AcrR family transcriptional regulator